MSIPHYQNIEEIKEEIDLILKKCNPPPFIAFDLDYTLWPLNCYESSIPPYSPTKYERSDSDENLNSPILSRSSFNLSNSNNNNTSNVVNNPVPTNHNSNSIKLKSISISDTTSSSENVQSINNENNSISLPLLNVNNIESANTNNNNINKNNNSDLQSNNQENISQSGSNINTSSNNNFRNIISNLKILITNNNDPVSIAKQSPLPQIIENESNHLVLPQIVSNESSNNLINNNSTEGSSKKGRFNLPKIIIPNNNIEMTTVAAPSPPKSKITINSQDLIYCFCPKTNNQRSFSLYPETKSVLDWCYNKNLELTICSRSPDFDLVAQILKAFGLLDYFTYPQIFSSRKSYHFRNLVEITGKVFSNFLLFDDDINNITLCKKMGINCYLVDKSSGMNWASLLNGLKSYYHSQQLVVSINISPTLTNPCDPTTPPPRILQPIPLHSDLICIKIENNNEEPMAL